MTAAGPFTSQREREAMTIERDADDVARCFLLERELLRTGLGDRLRRRGDRAPFRGRVRRVRRPWAFEGMLPVRRMTGDWWELNEPETMLVGARSGRALRLGDSVRVQVGRVDAPRGRVDLYPLSQGNGQGTQA